MGSIPINIITTGGQTFAVASNLQGGIPAQVSQMQIRPIAPNAATVVSHHPGTTQQIRAGKYFCLFDILRERIYVNNTT